MNTKNKWIMGITSIILLPFISLLFLLSPSLDAGQAAAIVVNDEEGWSSVLEAENGLSIFDLAPTDDGNVLLVGFGNDNGPFAFTARIKPDGKIDKAVRINNTYFYDVLATSDGGHLIMGAYGLYLLKLDSSGEIIWQKNYRNDQNIEQTISISDIEETSDGGYIAAGVWDSKAFLLKLSSTGDIVWKQLWPELNRFVELSPTAGEKYLLFGTKGLEPYIARINEEGATVWQKKLISSSPLYTIQKAVTTNDGNILANAYQDGTPWLAKLTPEGTIVWQYTYSSPAGRLQFNDMKALPNGNAILVGLIEPYQNPDYFPDGLAMEIDANGITQWLRTYSSDYQAEIFRSGIIDSQGSIYMAGYLANYENGDDDVAWVVKLAEKGKVARCPGVEEIAVSTTPTDFNLDSTGSTNTYISVSVNPTDWTAEPLEIEQTQLCPLPHISVEKSGPQTAVGGVPFSYNLTVTNNAEEAFTGVEIRDKLPAGTTYISGGSLEGDEVVWDVGRLEGGAQATEQLTISARQKVTNEAYGVTCAEGYSTAGDEKVVTQIENLIQLPVINTDYCADYFDDFSDPKSGWPVIDADQWRTSYVAGQYELLTKAPGALGIPAPACSRWYYVVEADMEWESAPGPGIGLLFDISPDGRSFHRLTLDTFAQTYQFEEIYPDAGSSTGDSSPFINTGRSKNHLKITRMPNEVFIEINGESVTSYYVDDAREKTLAGLAAKSSQITPSTQARFDNFSYTWLETQPGQPVMKE